MPTPLEMLRAVIDIALEREWVEEARYCGRGCNCLRGYHLTCSKCEGHGKHEANCEVDQTLREAEAFIAVEEQRLQDEGVAL